MNTVELKNDRQRNIFLEWVDQEILDAREKLNDLVELKNQVLDKTSASKPLRRTNFSWRDLCRKAVDNADSFLTTDDVYQRITELAPNKTHGNRRKTVASISAALSGLAKSNEFTNFEHPKIQGYFWGRKEWLGNDGLPKGKYREKLKDKGYDFDLSFFNENEEASYY